jgi:hypothetical protein
MNFNYIQTLTVGDMKTILKHFRDNYVECHKIRLSGNRKELLGRLELLLGEIPNLKEGKIAAAPTNHSPFSLLQRKDDVYKSPHNTHAGNLLNFEFKNLTEELLQSGFELSQIQSAISFLREKQELVNFDSVMITLISNREVSMYVHHA